MYPALTRWANFWRAYGAGDQVETRVVLHRRLNRRLPRICCERFEFIHNGKNV
jgi:hypothetical protein